MNVENTGIRKALTDLRVEIIGMARHCCDVSWNHPNVNSSFSRIYHISSGKGYAVLEGTRFELLPRHVYLLPAFTNFDVWCPKRMTQFFIHFKAETRDGVDLFHLFRYRPMIAIGGNRYVGKLCSRLEEMNENLSMPERIEAEGLTRALAALFLDPASELEGREKMRGTVRFRKSLSHMEKNYVNPISLSQLAAIENLQPTYYSNQFNKLVGKPPIQFLIDKRLRKAQDLLANQDLSIAETAEAVGFRDAFHFSRAFKKRTGSSPSRYQRLKLEC